MKLENTIFKNRKGIDKITNDLVKLMAKRSKLVLDIGKAKKKLNLPLIDSKREMQMVEDARKLSKKFGVNPKLVNRIMKLLIEDARRLQSKVR